MFTEIQQIFLDMGEDIQPKDEQQYKNIRLQLLSDIQLFKDIDRIIQYNYVNRLKQLVINDPEQSYHYNKINYLEENVFLERIQQLICCNEQMIRTFNNKYYVCTQCGINIPINKKTNKYEVQKQKTKNSSYQAIKHFESIFNNIFKYKQHDVSQQLIDSIKALMKRDRKSKVTIEDVRQYIKQINKGKGSSYNKLDSIIMQIVNGEKLEIKISPDEYKFIKELYTEIVNLYYKMNTERNNTPNVSYIIKCIIDLLYKERYPVKYKQLISYIHMQKEQTITKIRKTWFNILPQLDIPTIKQQFYHIVEQQAI